MNLLGLLLNELKTVNYSKIGNKIYLSMPGKTGQELYDFLYANFVSSVIAKTLFPASMWSELDIEIGEHCIVINDSNIINNKDKNYAY